MQPNRVRRTSLKDIETRVQLAMSLIKRDSDKISAYKILKRVKFSGSSTCLDVNITPAWQLHYMVKHW